MSQTRMVKPRDEIIHGILTEVSEARGVELLDLPPVGETIDADALQNLLESSGDVQIAFEYAGYEIAVSNENISVRER